VALGSYRDVSAGAGQRVRSSHVCVRVRACVTRTNPLVSEVQELCSNVLDSQPASQPAKWFPGKHTQLHTHSRAPGVAKLGNKLARGGRIACGVSR
jgi:hypothetical protein